MDQLGFKIVKTHAAGDELVALIGNFEICKAAFEKALFLYPNEHLEMRQGARVILASKIGRDILVLKIVAYNVNPEAPGGAQSAFGMIYRWSALTKN